LDVTFLRQRHARATLGVERHISVTLGAAAAAAASTRYLTVGRSGLDTS
jgi:hypothetical protein